MKLLLLGATGLVGRHVLTLALDDSRFSAVSAPTRSPLAPHVKLANPVAARLEQLIPSLIAQRPDAIICALGTTQAKAGSRSAFRHVDLELPVAVARAAHAAGVAVFAIVTASGASEGSRFFYYRIKGEVERQLVEIGFSSLTICRPSLIVGDRSHARWAEGAALSLLRLLGPLLPKRLRVNHAHVIASALIGAVLDTSKGCRRIDAAEMI